MAIYHLEAKVVSRGTGRSAVAASAYLSCSKILNDYDGVQHDYTRKKGLVWQEVFLPEFAPSEWKERGVLWNAVEENEKTKDSRLAREFVVALPIELSEAQWEKLLSDFISDTFVADGMCADVAIHDPYPPGHNPHAHIMLTVRPLDEKGNWQYKTQKEYLCVKNGEEQGFTADEFKAAQTEGWEEQYQYKVGKKKVYMTASAAEAKGYERVSKYPKSTKYGRQNPIALMRTDMPVPDGMKRMGSGTIWGSQMDACLRTAHPIWKTAGTRLTAREKAPMPVRITAAGSGTAFTGSTGDPAGLM